MPDTYRDYLKANAPEILALPVSEKLALAAALLNEHGDLAVGQAIKIIDIARHELRLHGHKRQS